VSYRFRYLICCSPPELEGERRVFHAALGQFNEEVAMKSGELLAAASLRPEVNAERQQAPIESNIRMCELFVQIFAEQPPPPVFQGFVDYALKQLEDPGAPMKRVAVLFRRAEPVTPESQVCRESLTARSCCTVREFRDDAELTAMVRESLDVWYATVRDAEGQTAMP
jgi:hypothetical protein